MASLSSWTVALAIVSRLMLTSCGPMLQSRSRPVENMINPDEEIEAFGRLRDLHRPTPAERHQVENIDELKHHRYQANKIIHRPHSSEEQKLRDAIRLQAEYAASQRLQQQQHQQYESDGDENLKLDQPQRSSRNYKNPGVLDAMSDDEPEAENIEPEIITAYVKSGSDVGAPSENRAKEDSKIAKDDESKEDNALKISFGSSNDIVDKFNDKNNLEPVYFHEAPAAQTQEELLHWIDKQSTESSLTDVYLFAVIAGCSVAAFAGLLVAGACWYRLRRNIKAASDVEYPAYGVTGPTKEKTGSPGDRKLAQSAQMYHYQHQKQQMIASERVNSDVNNHGSDAESEEDNEEGDYTVFECPGLATAGEMEVRNPLFSETPVSAPPPSSDPGKK